MAVLESCPKHNMVAYLEKTEGNAEFHEIIDFLKRSSIHHALTVSSVVSTTFVEQFWTSAKSKIINNVRHITAKVAGKSVSISEASIRSDLLFDDADGIDSLPNQAIFDAIQLMGLRGPSEAQPTPSPISTSEVPYEPQTNSSPAQTSENLLVRISEVSDQAKEIQALKAQITNLKKQAKPVIKHHRAYLKSVSVKQRFPRKSFSKKHKMHKESVSKQGRKFTKGESSVQRDPLFDEMPKDTVDHMDTENAQDEGRTREIVDEDKEIKENALSTEEVLSTDKEGVSTDFEKVSTDRPIVSTDGSKVSTDKQIESTDEQVEGTEEHNESTEEKNEGTEEIFEGTEDQTEEEIATQATQTPTSMIFGDDETIAKVLLNMSQAKVVSKEKDKGVDFESDKEMERKIQEEWEAEEERNSIAEEKAANEALIRNFDDIKARIEADRLLAEKLQEQEREQFTIVERASSFMT
ncbi:hypothetical protein Tco_0703683 [Tanacetum coccineum]|uniref:Uncharacterized protein n=1 Tax=Tanacetum coccineum TaxID=301880 RepID=A0ABQ4Y1F0_9ASTR